VVSATQDKVNFFIRGTGKNAPDYTEIVVNEHVIYRRRDETGLVLAVFSRLDLSLQWLVTYDTHRDRDASLRMASDLRQFNQSFLVVVASTIAWEWHASRTLAKTMEYCGAYHFGQWAHIFAEQPHYASNVSDLQQTASQAEFGHPYAFIGVPGTGTGMGWESLMYNTGQYLPRNLITPKAIIRGVFYYDYVARAYRLQDVIATKADFYLKGVPPAFETLHNPTPQEKFQYAGEVLRGMEPPYTPYVGTLQSQITKLIEANGTVPPYNYAFELVTDAGVQKVDPRPRSPRNYWETELERVWLGPSRRYWSNNDSVLNQGMQLIDRPCYDFIYHGYTEASPELCGENFEYCCADVGRPGLIALECNIGVSPSLCRNSERTQLQNQSALLVTKWPFPFRVIDWIS
jgi:hypothetical protein